MDGIDETDLACKCFERAIGEAWVCLYELVKNRLPDTQFAIRRKELANLGNRAAAAGGADLWPPTATAVKQKLFDLYRARMGFCPGQLTRLVAE